MESSDEVKIHLGLHTVSIYTDTIDIYIIKENIHFSMKRNIFLSVTLIIFSRQEFSNEFFKKKI